jgi:hypothetical protein
MRSDFVKNSRFCRKNSAGYAGTDLSGRIPGAPLLSCCCILLYMPDTGERAAEESAVSAYEGNCSVTGFPYFIQMQPPENGGGELQSGLSGMGDNFCRNVKKFASDSSGIAFQRNNRGKNVFFKAFKEKKCGKHHVIKGGVRSKSPERHLFKSEIFQRPEYEFCRAASVIQSDNFRRIREPAQLFRQICRSSAGRDICHKQRIRSVKGKHHLPVLIQRLAENDPAEYFPYAVFETELGEPPCLLFLIQFGKIFFRQRFQDISDSFRNTGAENVKYSELFKRCEIFLTEEAAVAGQYDNSVFSVFPADEICNLCDDLYYGLSVIAAAPAAPENGINDKPPPCYPKRLKSFRIFICRTDALTIFGLVIVHNHCVNVQKYDGRILHAEPPYEKLVQNLSEKPAFAYAEKTEKTLHRMRRCHFVRRLLYSAGIAGIFCKLVKPCEMPACAVKEPAENLLKKVFDRQAFLTFPKVAEMSGEKGKYPDIVKVPDKKCETSPSGKVIVSFFYFADVCFHFVPFMRNIKFCI